MSEDKEGSQSQTYVFNYEWKTVMKGFWNKYPSKKLDFVKWNKVIGFDINEDGSIKFKRIIYIKKLYFIWAYGLEELTFDFKKKILDAKTSIIKKSIWVPYSAMEHIRYKEMHAKERQRTMYEKMITYKTGAVSSFLQKLNSSYKKGCMIVEEKCKILKEWEKKNKDKRNNEIDQEFPEASEEN